MGKKGGRKQKKGKPAAPAQDAPPADTAAEAIVDIEDGVETPSQPESPSISTPERLTDEPSRPSSPPAAEVSDPITRPAEGLEAEVHPEPAASLSRVANLTIGLSAVNLESEEGDIGMSQEDDVPAEEPVHHVEPEELGSGHGESDPMSLPQDKPQSGDLGDLGETADKVDEQTTSELGRAASPNSFKTVHPESSELVEAAAPPPPVESSATHTNFEDLQEFDEIDIGASTEPSPPEVATTSEAGQHTQLETATASASTGVNDAHHHHSADSASSSHEEDRSADQEFASAAALQDTTATSLQQEDSHPPPVAEPHSTHETEDDSADLTNNHTGADTPVRSRSESKTPTALGAPFEESSPSSVAHRPELPPLSSSTPPPIAPPPGAAPHTPPMLRSASSRLGIISPPGKGSPKVLMSPKFRSIDAVHTDDEFDDDGMEDMPMEGVPFESIPLDGDAEPSSSSARPSRPASIGSSRHSRNVSKESNLAPSRNSFPANGHVRVDSRGVPIVPSDRPKTPVSRAASATSASASASAAASPGVASPTSPQVNPVPANANQQPSQALGVKGVSAFEKFVSRTRPAHLPPKDKSEDQAHLHEWETMMAQARQHDAEERKKQAARQAAREKRVLEVTPRWEAMLNAKDFSAARVRADPAKRKLWFEGCPPRLRGKAWQLAIGNPLTLHKDAYKMYLKRSRRALENGRFPADILAQLEEDLDHTLNTLHIFQRGSPMRDELKELICAWVVYRSDEGLGYAPYINLLAAMFLLVLPIDQAFFSLVNFLSRPMLRAFYNEIEDEIAAFYRVFENLQADTFPRIFANCKNLGLKLPEAYFRSVLVEQVPFDTALRLWDQIVLDGDGYVFRAALAIFGFLEPRLYYPDREEIKSVLDGHNKASMLIQERERERAKLRGEVYDHHVDGTLSVFGLAEEPLFEWLANDRWQESRFERLVVRELPD